MMNINFGFFELFLGELIKVLIVSVDNICKLWDCEIGN